MKEKKSKNVSPSLYETFLLAEQEKDFFNKTAAAFVRVKKRNAASAMSIVASIHLELEKILNIIISVLCIHGAKMLKMPANFSLKVIERAGAITYYKKLKFVKSLNIVSPKSIDILGKANALRNAFAHNYKQKGSKYDYDNKSIFRKETIEKLIQDYLFVETEIANKVVNKIVKKK